jgi:hypothetical protein
MLKHLSNKNILDLIVKVIGSNSVDNFKRNEIFNKINSILIEEKDEYRIISITNFYEDIFQNVFFVDFFLENIEQFSKIHKIPQDPSIHKKSYQELLGALTKLYETLLKIPKYSVLSFNKLHIESAENLMLAIKESLISEAQSQIEIQTTFGKKAKVFGLKRLNECQLLVKFLKLSMKDITPCREIISPCWGRILDTKLFNTLIVINNMNLAIFVRV